MNIIRNNVQLVGNLGKDPEVKTLENGKKVAKLSIACTESRTNAEGHKIETTQWFNAVAWDGLAGVAEKFMIKGKQVAISGRLTNRQWEDKEGKAHYTTEIVVNDILLLSGGSRKK